MVHCNIRSFNTSLWKDAKKNDVPLHSQFFTVAILTSLHTFSYHILSEGRAGEVLEPCNKVILSATRHNCASHCSLLSHFFSRTLSLFASKGRAMAQAVLPRPLTAEARFRSQTSPCEICGGQSGAGTGFSPSYLVVPLSVWFHQCSMLICIDMLFLPEGQTDAAVSEIEEHCRENSFQSFLERVKLCIRPFM
jgi:hypothetical protein